MAEFDHLPLVRLPRIEPRRKTATGPPPPERDRGSHARKVRAEIAAVIAAETVRPTIEGIDPSLILKVEMSGQLAEDEWRRAGFRVLAQDDKRVLILFASDTELKEFRRRLAAYESKPIKDGELPPYNGLFANIEEVSPIRTDDRIGPRLRSDGVETCDAINPRRNHVVDIEVWDGVDDYERRLRVDKLKEYVEHEGGEELSRYVGDTGLLLLRAKVRGRLLRKLLDVAVIALIDSPPAPDLEGTNLSKITIADVGPFKAPPTGALAIGVIDSGVVAHPLLDGVTTESFGVPEELGDADLWGHGTKVAGVAVYGDVRERIAEGAFSAPFHLISAKVVNDEGRFDDVSSIPDQMGKAIRALHERGCRVINISLGDAKKIAYADGRVSPWAAILDALVRELDILIVVSAGNSNNGKKAPWGSKPDGVVTRYPRYLYTPGNRIVDPATAACVLTVGSIAHGNGLRESEFHGADIRVLTERDDPTPITRTGPGSGGAVKPELVDYGGTAVFNGAVQRLMTGRDWEAAGMASLRSNYQEALFTASSGTSMAAPRVAFKAALLLRRFPEASTNLLRALLVTCADVPQTAIERLKNVVPDAVRRCCGFGIPDVERALSSEERRIIRYADRHALQVDDFALYEVPIPEDFRRIKGERQIRATLAFDPPVRHTRLEYLGVRMSYRLIRGLTPEQIYEHYRRRPKGEPWPELPERHKCKLNPGYEARSVGSLQSATFIMKRNVEHYGETYYLAVFADRRWAGPDVRQQRYAAVVELMHRGEVRLYTQSRQRVRVQG